MWVILNVRGDREQREGEGEGEGEREKRRGENAAAAAAAAAAATAAAACCRLHNHRIRRVGTACVGVMLQGTEKRERGATENPPSVRDTHSRQRHLSF